MKLQYLLILLAIFLVACVPPGVEDVPEGGIEVDTEETAEEETTETNTTEDNATDVVEKEEATPKAVNSTVKIYCETGTKKCKGDVLLQCKSGKLIRERNCGKLGCWEEKRCGECLPGTKKCEGKNLVTCSSKGKKIIKDCYTCENKVCGEEPENPEPFTCQEVFSVDSKNVEVIQVYSAFKKDYVEQQLNVMNDPDNGKVKLGYINHKGTWIKEKSGNVHNDPIYLELAKCYVNCLVPLPLEVEITCKGGSTVNVFVPPYTSYPRSPIRLLVGKDGSTYFLDSTHDGEGAQLTVAQALSDTHLARKAK